MNYKGIEHVGRLRAYAVKQLEQHQRIDHLIKSRKQELTFSVGVARFGEHIKSNQKEDEQVRQLAIYQKDNKLKEYRHIKKAVTELLDKISQDERALYARIFQKSKKLKPLDIGTWLSLIDKYIIIERHLLELHRKRVAKAKERHQDWSSFELLSKTYKTETLEPLTD